MNKREDYRVITITVSGSEVPEPRSSQREAGSTDFGLDGRMML